MQQQTFEFADAEPTKEIFISILTRDLPLSAAIMDLVDNSVDGARRQGSVSKYEETIEVDFSENYFQIKDNCGGIDLKIARDYAFRFGRPLERQREKGLIGEFGVGMKRALFKIGRVLEVISTTSTTRFRLKIDVDAWRNNSEWKFPFTEAVDKQNFSKNEVGTVVRVESLYPEIAQQFGLEAFENEVISDLKDAHQDAILRGLQVKVNGTQITPKRMGLLETDGLRPGVFKTSINHSDSHVTARLYAGIAKSSPKEAGWYVFCNGRMILQADKSERTGWGEENTEVNIPKMHNQFSRFRGYAYFDCEDQSRLPWTTTKQGVDMTSAVYQQIRPEMVRMTRQVISFLNDLDREKDTDSTQLAVLVESAQEVPIHEINQEDRPFSFPEPSAFKNSEQELSRINYRMKKKLVDRVKEHLRVNSNREVGEQTFEYFVQVEGIDVE